MLTDEQIQKVMKELIHKAEGGNVEAAAVLLQWQIWLASRKTKTTSKTMKTVPLGGRAPSTRPDF